jgi:hypothetical protein
VKTLQLMRAGLLMAVLGLTSPVSFAGSTITVGTAGPLIAIRTGIPLGWRITVLNRSDAYYWALYDLEGKVGRMLLPPHKTTNIGNVLGREIPTFRFASVWRAVEQ